IFNWRLLECPSEESHDNGSYIRFDKPRDQEERCQPDDNVHGLPEGSRQVSIWISWSYTYVGHWIIRDALCSREPSESCVSQIDSNRSGQDEGQYIVKTTGQDRCTTHS